MNRFPLITVLLLFVSGGLYVFTSVGNTFLTWTNSAPSLFSWVSTHFMHVDMSHFVWNFAGLMILAGLIEQYSRRTLLMSLMIGVIAVDLYLLLYYQLDAYAGLSGALNSLLVVALMLLYQHEPHMQITCQFIFLMAFIKILFEWYTSISLFTSMTWQSVPLAHLAGFIGGCFYIITKQILDKKNGKISSYYRHA